MYLSKSITIVLQVASADITKVNFKLHYYLSICLWTSSEHQCCNYSFAGLLTDMSSGWSGSVQLAGSIVNCKWFLSSSDKIPLLVDNNLLLICRWPNDSWCASHANDIGEFNRWKAFLHVLQAYLYNLRRKKFSCPPTQTAVIYLPLVFSTSHLDPYWNFFSANVQLLTGT